MIIISKQTAMRAINSGRLSKKLIKQQITIVMQQDDAKRWLAVLRDGKQKQAKGTLYDPTQQAFCCLGLEQACNFGGNVQVSENGFFFLSLPTTAYLHSTGKGYFNAGERACAPSVFHKRWKPASVFNDSGYSFAQIADLLEKHMAVYA